MKKTFLIGLGWMVVAGRGFGLLQAADMTAPAMAGNGTHSFPGPNEVLQGRVFASTFDRDVFFLRRIHADYPADWVPLLAANLTVSDYVLAPDKLLRFVEELGAALAQSDDPAAATNLAVITSDPAFYANPNGYWPRIQDAATAALIGIGPRGRQVLAQSFSETHYRNDPASLQDLAEFVGKTGTADPNLATALAAAAFAFTTTNGGCYPHCTGELTRNLLRLPDGPEMVRPYLNTNAIFADPGRFQAVMDGIAAAGATELASDLAGLTNALAAKLSALSDRPGLYRDDVSELQRRLDRTLAELRRNAPKNRP